jgi:hypothetical protein
MRERKRERYISQMTQRRRDMASILVCEAYFHQPIDKDSI